MSRGTKIIILIGAGLVVIAAIGIYVIWPLVGQLAPAGNANANANVNGGLSAGAADQNSNVNGAPAANVPLPKEVSEVTKSVSTAKTVAKTFAERLATYSNQNGLANVSDVSGLATAAVNKYLNGQYRSDLIKSMPAGSDYYGVTSVATNVNLAPSSEGEMTGKVQLQQVESGARQSVAYKVLDLKLKLVSGGWLVSWIEWEK